MTLEYRQIPVMQHGNGGQAKKNLLETSFSCLTPGVTPIIFILGYVCTLYNRFFKK